MSRQNSRSAGSVAERNETPTDASGQGGNVTEPTPEEAVATDKPKADKVDIGDIVVLPSTRAITGSRVRTANNPIHNAVAAAEQGTWYDLHVRNDATVIDRVSRQLRTAAQKLDVGMSISPERIASDEQIAGGVIVSFRTGERDKRKAVGGEGAAGQTPGAGTDTPSE